MRDYTNKLRQVRYIVAVHHPVMSSAAPPPEWFTATWKGKTYHKQSDTDKGFLNGSPEYSIVVLNDVLDVTRLPEQV